MGAWVTLHVWCRLRTMLLYVENCACIHGEVCSCSEPPIQDLGPCMNTVPVPTAEKDMPAASKAVRLGTRASTWPLS
eukprot:1157380-Pelagomonas_calceolata.AAC.18